MLSGWARVGIKAMQFNVSQLLKAAIGSSRDYQIQELFDITGDGTKKPVLGKINLIRTDRSILVKGELHTEINITCSRCLQAFTSQLNLNIEEEYYPITDINNTLGSLTSAKAGSFNINEHHVIDLSEAVRQYTLMAIPMKPLCTENCAGLCPSCGQNLNQGNCGCSPPENDMRWQILTKLAKNKTK